MPYGIAAGGAAPGSVCQSARICRGRQGACREHTCSTSKGALWNQPLQPARMSGHPCTVMEKALWNQPLQKARMSGHPCTVMEKALHPATCTISAVSGMHMHDIAGRPPSGGTRGGLAHSRLTLEREEALHGLRDAAGVGRLRVLAVF